MTNYKKIVVSIILPIMIIVGALIHYKYSENYNIPNLEATYDNNIHRYISSGNAKESKDLLKLELKVLESKDLSKVDELEGFDFESALKVLEYTMEDRASRDIDSKL